MATITVQCKDGEVAIELLPDESSEDAARRLSSAIADAGGVRVPRSAKKQQVRHLMTVEERRHREMSERGLLECERCGTWVPAMQAAAARHMRRCTAAAQAGA